jgi:NAD(P)-dependent dehydrogenase (short-subunit alcohol dehydrogenase family)
MELQTGQTAVITGAASGIGLALTEAFAAVGLNVVMADWNEEALQTEAARLEATGASVRPVVTDVSDGQAVERLGATAVEAFGGLHIAVNNAGVVLRGRAWELSIQDWSRVLDVNLWGVIHGIRSFVPRILDTGGEGHVVNTASMAAVLPRALLGPYTVAKHGVLGLSDVLRADLADAGAPVGVSVVMPGLIRTGMVPIGTISAETVAANVVDAVRRSRSYVFTDDHDAETVRARLTAILAARDDVLPSTTI